MLSGKSLAQIGQKHRLTSWVEQIWSQKTLRISGTLRLGRQAVPTRSEISWIERCFGEQHILKQRLQQIAALTQTEKVWIQACVCEVECAAVMPRLAPKPPCAGQGVQRWL